MRIRAEYLSGGIEPYDAIDLFNKAIHRKLRLDVSDDSFVIRAATNGRDIWVGAAEITVRGTGFNDALTRGTVEKVIFRDSGTGEVLARWKDVDLSLKQINGLLDDEGEFNSPLVRMLYRQEWRMNFSDDSDRGLPFNNPVYNFLGDDVIRMGDGFDKVQAGSGNDTIWGEDGIDRLYGGGGDDLLFGGQERDRLYGDGGHDTIRGAAGEDYLKGWIGEDVLFGGRDQDYLIGGHETDTLNGGRGNDRLFGDHSFTAPAPDHFVFFGAFGRDRIMDFDVDVEPDIIHLLARRDVATGQDVIDNFARQVGDDVVIEFAADKRIMIMDTQRDDLTADHFMIWENRADFWGS